MSAFEATQSFYATSLSLFIRNSKGGSLCSFAVMLKRIWCAYAALCLVVALSVGSASAATSETSVLDRYAYNPFAVSLAVAGAGISVATAANAITAAATALASAGEVIVTAATIVGASTAGTVLVTGLGLGAVLMIGTTELTSLFEAARGTARAFQGR